ncbi:hypothetical protein KUV85_17240 [Nocardioides panacisoli]|uniref:hypothetical protein n=1 Tax=Nocardioides panacisoli TaxID=627624 RepID=UPI001C631724|nr:hypothetical protein [Nocardioides panacisoli]QYJ04044.1 hypothetical protein KUV85_17240 [Nocardioides panacisoli]
MSEMGYLIWLIATAVLTTGILIAVALEGAIDKRHGPPSPREAKQYWPHTSGQHH